MIDVTRTTTVLLEGLHDAGNESVWQEFDTRYRPIVEAFARRLGLRDADAADVAQETMVQFLGEYQDGKYDRERGRLRSWLMGIARFKIAGVYRKRASKREARGDSAMMNLEDDARLTLIWDDERRAVVLRAAMEELRTTTKASDRTVRAFEMLIMHQVPVATVAEEMNMSAQEVYLAKSRMAKRLREIVERLEQAFDGDA